MNSGTTKLGCRISMAWRTGRRLTEFSEGPAFQALVVPFRRA